MKIIQDLFCFCYMFLSSIGLLYQLGSQSIVSIQCETSKTFCLKHVNYESSFRYTFTAKDLEFRCNTEGFSVLLRLLVFLGVFYELVLYGGAIYVHYYKPKTIGVDIGLIFQRCVYATASITGLLICIFVLLPVASYSLPSGGGERRGVITEIWVSPFKGLVLMILNIITAPLRWIFHNRFKTALGLDEIYTNYTCVEPSMRNGLLTCPMELQILPNMPELSNCESQFFCTRDCLVVFPRILINSLAFIFASLVLFYRLLKLTHYITKRETGFDLIATDDGRNTVKSEELNESQDRNLSESVLDELSGSDMKDKSVGRSTKVKAAGLKKGEKDVYPRRYAVRKREEIQENTLQPKTQGLHQTQLKTDSHTDQFTENGKAITESSDVFNPETNLNRTTEITADNLELFEPEEANLDRCNGITPHSSKILEANLDSFSEHNFRANGTRENEYKDEQYTSLRRNTESKKNESKLLTTSKKYKVCVTEETEYSKKTSNYSEHKIQGKTKNLEGKSTRSSRSNGHSKQEAKVYRRKTEVENGVSEVKMGPAGNCNGNEGYEEPEWSSSEDIVEGIEGLLVVEDESEFFMSGFRL